MEKKIKNGGLTDETVEAVMLSDPNEVLEQRLLEELRQEHILLDKAKNAKPNVITEFAKVPEELVFSEKASYCLFNRTTKREFYITGADLERRIGLDLGLYKKLKSRAVKAICVDNNVITFYQARL